MDTTTSAAGLSALREHLHRSWASVAPGWEANADYADERGADVTKALLGLARLGAGDRVLELAAGAGGVGLAAAERVGPHGEVVVSDVAPEMTAIARRRAGERGLANVSVRELDLESIDEPDAAFDAVLCREGLMLVPDPAQAAREIRRVLRPGGRVAVAVWGPRARNPWLQVVFDTVSAQLGTPVPPPGVPGPFSLDDGERLAAVLGGAGLGDVEVREVDVPYRASSVAEWWTRTAALAGPLAGRLAALPEPARIALRGRAAAAAEAYRTPDGLLLPGVSLVAGAARA
ncbi:MAG TPA: class I SAM-dependent methyltransferase [Gaiellaceae bacterium]